MNKMHKYLRIGGGAALAIFSFVLSASAATLIDTPATITSTVTTDNGNSDIQIDADVTVGNGGKFYLGWAGKCYIPYSEGKDITVTTDGGGFEAYYPAPNNPNRLYLGANGGKGHLICKTESSLNHIWVMPRAEADDSGYIDFLRVENGLKGNYAITNTTAPARITFAPNGYLMCAKWKDNIRNLFDIGAGSELILYGEDSAGIKFSLNQGDQQPSFVFSAGEGKLTTAGNVDMKFDGNGGVPRVYFAADENHVEWKHTGDTIFANLSFPVLAVDQGLPHGPNTGVIKFMSDVWSRQAYFDMNGHTSAVNGVSGNDAAQDSYYITNSVEQLAVLQLGTRNEDSTFVCKGTFGNLLVEKLGTGTLNVGRNSNYVNSKDPSRYTQLKVSCGTMKIADEGVVAGTVTVAADGTLRINANTPIDALTIDGGKLIVENGLVSVGTFKCINGGKVVLIGNGRIEVSGETIADSADYISRGYNGDAEISGAANGTEGIEVLSGTLTVYDADQDNKFWRFRLRTTQNSVTTLDLYDMDGNKTGTQDVNVGLAKFHLFGTFEGAPDAGKRISGGIASELPAGTSPALLSENQAVSAKPYLNGVGKINTQPDGAMLLTATNTVRGVLANSWEEVMFFNNGPLKNDDESTWETVAFRLAASVPPVRGCAFSVPGYTAPGINPMGIAVECSPDGTDGSWVRKADIACGNGHYKHPAHYYPDNAIWPLTNNPHGAFNTYGTIMVAKGATLDLSQIPVENVAIHALEYDWATGAGTIKNFAPARNGTLKVINVPDSTSFYDVPLDIALEGAADCRLKGWQVIVNGKSCRTSYPLVSNGQLIIHDARTLMITVR